MKQENLNTDNIYSAFKKHDNWREYNYDKRILDSFASVFHLKGAVTATCKYKNNLYISYNHQISSAENHIKNQIKLFDFIVKKGSAVDLLNFYLILNVDHKEFIKNQWLHE